MITDINSTQHVWQDNNYSEE